MGAQNERTALSWSRTTLSLAALGLVVLRAAVAEHAWPALLLGLVSITGSAVGLRLVQARYARNGRAVIEGVIAADGRLPALLAVSTIALGLAGAWTTML